MSLKMTSSMSWPQPRLWSQPGRHSRTPRHSAAGLAVRASAGLSCCIQLWHCRRRPGGPRPRTRGSGLCRRDSVRPWGRLQAREDPVSPKVTMSENLPRMGPRWTFRGAKPLTLSPALPIGNAASTRAQPGPAPKMHPFFLPCSGAPPQRPLPQPAPGSTSRWAGSCGLAGRLSLVPWSTLTHPSELSGPPGAHPRPHQPLPQSTLVELEFAA